MSITGWSNGLNQDYSRGLSKWFASRLGSRYEQQQRIEPAICGLSKSWTVTVWDGHSTSSFQRSGTYEQVRNSLAGLPPACIWSIS